MYVLYKTKESINLLQKFFLVFVIVFIFSPAGILNESGFLSNGFGDKINWKSWPEALILAEETEKPIMVVLHKSSCPACKAFKPVFANSNEISELSSKFVMVNAKLGQEPSAEPKLNVDGKYVPRIIFLDSKSNVLKDVINKHGNPKYKYFHQTANTVIEAMELALKITSEAAISNETPSAEL